MIKENDTTMKFLKAITDRMHPWAYKKENEEFIVEETARISHYLDMDLDSNGNTILDKFPYRVELAPPLIDEKYDGVLDWLDEYINKDEFTREWVTRVYFKNEEDDIAFKLRRI